MIGALSATRDAMGPSASEVAAGEHPRDLSIDFEHLLKL
jgi:hypothetical protein